MIVVLAIPAVVGVLLGYRRHRPAVPLILALVGAALILWVMLGRYDRLTELAGFAALAVGRPSVRNPGGECAGLFYPDLASNPRQGRHLDYHWDGTRVDLLREPASGNVYRMT